MSDTWEHCTWANAVLVPRAFQKYCTCLVGIPIVNFAQGLKLRMVSRWGQLRTLVSDWLLGLLWSIKGFPHSAQKIYSKGTFKLRIGMNFWRENPKGFPIQKKSLQFFAIINGTLVSNFRGKARHSFPKQGLEEGSKAVWSSSENSSKFSTGIIPNTKHISMYRWEQ